jgi:GYF domain 2
MTGQQPDIQWYIARDGKQHGPLSDVEMRAFVAQGHLKPTDLIWRPGFADWRPAPAVFSFQAPEQLAPAPRPGVTRPTGPSARTAPSSNERSFEPERIRVARGDSGTQPSRAARLAGIGLILALLAGGGWFFFLHKGASETGPLETVEAPKSEQSPSSSAATQTAAQTPPPPPVSQAEVEQGAQALDARFQQTPMWSVVKREFPDWYSEQLKEAATLYAQKQPPTAVYKHLAEALVALRRQHAQEALAASTEKLKVVASAFLDNLKSLSERSVGACFGFISQGETAPVVLELMQTPNQAASVQAQVAAIFEAIADGRKTPTQHEKAVKTDYEVLVQELSKLGWKENDLKVFSNPQALSHEPPNRVCQMVQDWFTAHLAVADKATQERLLVETLKPVVSG